MFVFCLLSSEASKIFTLDDKQFAVSKRLTCWLAEKNKTGLQGPFDRSVHFVLCYSFVCVLGRDTEPETAPDSCTTGV